LSVLQRRVSNALDDARAERAVDPFDPVLIAVQGHLAAAHSLLSFVPRPEPSEEAHDDAPRSATTPRSSTPPRSPTPPRRGGR
jgi:hypothetical protein